MMYIECPFCGANLKLNGRAKTQDLERMLIREWKCKCEYCGTQFTHTKYFEVFDEIDAELNVPSINTPRFGHVDIEKVFDSVAEMEKAGFREPTHYRGKMKIQGKSLDQYHMVFAAAPAEPKVSSRNKRNNRGKVRR